jgi:CRP-like cAMP-binding protein
MDDMPAYKTMPRLNESLLAHLPPFSRLDARQIRVILEQATAKRYDAGSVIFDEGATASRFYMLLDGYVRVVRITVTGEQVTALHVPAGQLIGIARALGKERYPATVITASEALVLSWPTRLWDRFVAEYDGFASVTYKTVGDRLGEMNTRIVEMATQQVEQRVANALLRLANQTGRKVPEGIEINFRMTRSDLSELTGTTLHTASRLLSQWEKDGIVLSRNKRITICDPHALVVRSQP